MRRSSIGLPLRPSYSPHAGGGGVSFNDDALLDGDDDVEELESPRRASERQLQTPRRTNHSNTVQDDDESPPKARSKGKEKATNHNHDEGDVEEEIVRGLEDVDMQQEDEDNEVTPKKKPTEKRPRKKRATPEVLRKSPFIVTQPSS